MSWIFSNANSSKFLFLWLSKNRFAKDVPSEQEVQRIMSTSRPDDALMNQEIFPDYPQWFTTILALDNDDIFRAHAEYRRQTRASTSPEMKDIFVKVSHIFELITMKHYEISYYVRKPIGTRCDLQGWHLIWNVFTGLFLSPPPPQIVLQCFFARKSFCQAFIVI